MSPEIRIGSKTIINVPDETALYETPSGKPLYVNTDLIDASTRSHKHKIVIVSDAVGGTRVLGLTHEGIGRSDDPKRGDGKLPIVSVKLHSIPIRYYGYANPRWVRGHGQR